MLNKFRTALRGPQAVNGDSPSLDYVYKDSKLERRDRGSLTRSSSFEEKFLREWDKTYELQDEAAMNRVKVTKRGGMSLDRGDEEQATNSASKQRGKPDQAQNGQKVVKFPYSRPEFLQLKTYDEINVSADHVIRPIILPRDVTRLPWMSGYAECINAGKSSRNEDQAVCHQDVIVGMRSRPDSIKGQIPFTLFGLYDGHAGDAVAVAAANQLHHIISEKLRLVADLLIALEFANEDLVSMHQGEVDDGDEDMEELITALSSTERESSVQDDGQSTDPMELCSVTESCVVADDKASLQADPCPSSDRVESKDSCEAANGNPHDESVQKGPDSNDGEIVAGGRDEQFACPPKEDSKEEDLDGEKIVTAPPIPPKEENLDGEQIESAPLIESGHPNAAGAGPGPYQRNWPRTDAGVTVENLVIGALEAAFWEMDEIIGRDKEIYKMPGGCAAIVSLFILGKLYVCNAGDSRAIVCKRKEVIPMSFDFTPTSERDRLLRLGHQRPELLGNDFTNLEFIRRPTREDLGKQLLYRDAFMKGWSMKEISYDDLRIPLVWGEGKRSRLCACIGLSRGFGDHELRSSYGGLPIKPFLTAEPEVQVLNLEEDNDLTSEDVLIQASDGLWDVATNGVIANQVDMSLMLENEVSRSKYRYVSVAQDLVLRSRGFSTKNRAWRMSNGRFASMDDISVFVVPLKQYRDEYLEWKRLRNEATLPQPQSKFSDKDKRTDSPGRHVHDERGSRRLTNMHM